MEREADCNCLN